MSIGSREKEVFDIAKQIAREEGLSSLTIRRLAEESNISVGSVYNLFETKDNLILKLIENYWTSSLDRIFKESENSSGDFIFRLNQLYISFKSASEEFHEDWIKDLVGAHMSNPDIVHMSNKYKKLVEFRIKELLEEDKNISKKFDKDLTSEKLVGFIFENMMILLRDNKEDLDFLKIILEKILS